MTAHRLHLSTRLIHSQRALDATEPGATRDQILPIVRATVHSMQAESAYGEIRYGRLSTLPNQLEAGALIADIEEAEEGLVTASGMAAITTALMSVLGRGGHVLAQSPLYGGTQSFLQKQAPMLGISASLLTPDPDSWKSLLTKQTKAIYVESITNPLLEVIDHQAVVNFAKEHNLVAMIDNTFTSPVNFQPVRLGYDLVLHSATKYLNGHSDVIAGAVVGKASLIRDVKHWLDHLGGALDPSACYLLRRGLKTLELRVEQQNANAQSLAAFLESQPNVLHVRYPGLESHRDHERAKALFQGMGGMLAFELKGDVAARRRFVSALRVAIHSPSLGGVETLVTAPATTSHALFSPEERLEMGISDTLLRVSVGIEHIDDLIEDFEHALEAI